MARLGSLCKSVLGVNDIIVDNFDVIQDNQGVISLYLDVRPYSRKRNCCPYCGKCCSGYDTAAKPRLWRAMDWGGMKVYLRYKVPRISCPDHGIVTAAVPWAFHGSGFTKSFDLLVAWQAKHLPRTAISELQRIDWQTVGRCVARAQQHLDPDADKRRLSGLVRIGVDETSYRKGHKYITIVVNHDTGEVVWVHDGHGKAVFEKFFKKLTEEQRKSIQHVSGDGAKWIDTCISDYIPHAQRSVDPFHVVQWAGQCLDDVRTRIWQTLRGEGKDLTKKIKECDDEDERKQLENKLKEHNSLTRSIKGSTYALGKAPENLTSAQSERLSLIAETQPVLRKAYEHKEDLRMILKLKSSEAAKCLQNWYYRASHSRIPEVKELAQKIKRHFGNILNSIRYGLSNARIEATNNKIKLAIRRAFGFRNLSNLISYVMLVCSKVEIPLPNRPKEVS